MRDINHFIDGSSFTGASGRFSDVFDPNTGEDELAFAGASLVPQTAAADRDPNNPSSWGKVGRNENCPCGSGKKYKHCHGRYA